MVIKNKFSKRCECCGDQVGVGEGFAFVEKGTWHTVCKSTACHRKLGLSMDQNRDNVRKLTEDGKIIMGYDKNAITLLRSMPGARWNPGEKHWTVSVKTEDLDRVIEIADQLKLDVPDSLRNRASVGTVDSQEAEKRAKRVRVDGSPLYDFQKDGVRFLALHNRALMADDMGLGKAQPVDEMVLTPTGWTKIGYLKVGSSVIGSNGKSTIVTGRFPQGELDIYEIKFNDGSSTRCSIDHLWNVQTPNDRVRSGEYRTMTLGQIMDKGIFDKNHNSKWFIPVVEPVCFDDCMNVKLPLDPYLMGVLLANGSFRHHTINHSGNNEQRNAFLKLIPEFCELNKQNDVTYNFIIKEKYYGEFSKNYMTEIAITTGLQGKYSYEKFIPEEYMFSTIENRLSLLQGLMDNDGTVSEDGMVSEYNTTSKQLADNVVSLVQSLGGIARLSTREPKYKYKNKKKTGRTDYRIRIKLQPNMVPFRIESKLSRHIAPTKYLPSRAISSIEKVGEEDCICIRVDAKDSLYVTKNYIVTHNTVQALVAIPEKSRVLVTCPSAVKYNWRDEIQLWRPDYSIRIVKGKKDDNIVPAEGEIVIVNYDILPKWLMPSIDSGKINRKGDPILVADIPSDKRSGLSETIVIFDEGHLAKNYKAQRTQKVTQLSKNVAKVWVLTGTPLMNRPFDLWGVLCAFGMYPLGGFSKFVNLFNGSCGKHGGYEFGLPTQEVVERMKKVMIRRLKKDVLKDLPPKTYQRIEVDCSSRSLNKELKELAQEIADAQGMNFDADDFSMLDLDTIPDFNTFSRVRALLAKAKIPAMLNLIEEHEETDTPVVVFSAHRAPIDELASRDGWDVITGDTSAEDRQNVVRRFQCGELKGVGLTIKAGGVGLTLTRASNAIFVDLDWTPSWNIQAEDRICRIGQKSDNVTIKRLVSSHPLDLHIQNIIEYKVKLAYMALDNDYVFKGKVSSQKSDFVDIKEESDEELSERIRNAEYEANREYYSQKIRRVAERESERVSHVPEPELTEERKSLLRGALGHLCSVCDGAFLRDGMGFNKPDACIGHWMASIDMETAEDDIYRVLERILVRYRKTQLTGKFDGIWS